MNLCDKVNVQEVQQELHRTQAEQQKDHNRAEELQKTADDLRRAEADLKARSQELQQKALGLGNEVEELQNQVLLRETFCIATDSPINQLSTEHDVRFSKACERCFE